MVYVLDNDTDSDGDDLSVTGLDTLTTAGNVTINMGDTTVSYTAPVGYSGIDSFRYFVSDGRGGADTATVRVDVRMLSAVYMGGGIPLVYDLSHNFPNPFNPETEFRYQLPRMCDVYAVIYSMLGQQVIQLVNEKQPAGYFKLKWDGRNSRGLQSPSGIYILRMQAGSYSAIRKMMLLR